MANEKAVRDNAVATIKTPTSSVDDVIDACRFLYPLAAELNAPCAAASEKKALALVAAGNFREANPHIRRAVTLGAGSPELTAADRAAFDAVELPSIQSDIKTTKTYLANGEAESALVVVDKIAKDVAKAETRFPKHDKLAGIRTELATLSAKADKLAAKEREKARRIVEAEERRARAAAEAKRFVHLTGCENGELLVPDINLWSVPGGLSAGATIVGTVRGSGVRGRCKGDRVEVLEQREVHGRTFYRVAKGDGASGWITDSFVPP